MEKRECIAMILADGRGTRLGTLTGCSVKSAIVYGGSHRIIDFTLSNCGHSGIDVLGVLTQRLNGGLDSYIGDGRMWNLSRTFMLPSPKGERNYQDPVDAIYRNIGFIERFSPKYVCVLSGDHIYKMNYAEMLGAHKRNGADATIAVVEAPFWEARRHEDVDVDADGKIVNFGGNLLKVRAKKHLVSMGVHIFNWSALRRHLVTAVNEQREVQKDFGKAVIPAMLCAGERLYAHRFEGYWRDAETVESLWESNMDLLNDPPKFVLDEKNTEVFPSLRSQRINRSILSGLHVVLGRVERSILSDSVVVEEGAEVIDSVLMPNVYVGKNTKIRKAVIGPNVKIMNNVEIGAHGGISSFISERICTNGVSLVAPGTYIAEKQKFQKNSHIENRFFGNNCDFHTVCLDRRYRTDVPPGLLTTA
ncbi:MAG: glucose-1-phosphate adenylyltransferase [Synergistaceae bacterium]|jgi:glucose-1-phosphate adenylyltransferase|nr:glucose-1-phosphate adenylyltransferase [Synergistaceae bacterium]